MRRKRWFLWLGFSITAFAIVYYFLLCFGLLCSEGPSVVQALRHGELKREDVVSVAVIRHNPVGYMPFSRTEYEQYEQVELADPEVMSRLIALLVQSTDGRLYKNHPAKVYGGFLRMDCADGSFYYIYYDLYYRDEYYVSIEANRRDERNPNCARSYYSRRLVTFLKEHDPWFEDFSRQGLPASGPGYSQRRRRTPVRRQLARHQRRSNEERPSILSYMPSAGRPLWIQSCMLVAIVGSCPLVVACVVASFVLARRRRTMLKSAIALTVCAILLYAIYERGVSKGAVRADLMLVYPALVVNFALLGIAAIALRRVKA